MADASDVDPDRPWDRELTPQELAEAARDWPDASPARQRHYMKLRLRANFLKTQPHPDDPTRRALGGPQPGSGPKRARLGEYLVQRAQEAQKKIWDSLEAGLDEKDDTRLRVKAADTIVKIVQSEEDIAIRREEIARDLDKKPLEEVKAMLAQKLAEQIDRGDITPEELARMFGLSQQPPAIEGSAVELG